MQNKRKIYCYHSGCDIYSFESKGTLTWECYRHNKCEKEIEVSKLSTDEKLELLLEHLGLKIETEPKVVEIEKNEAN